VNLILFRFVSAITKKESIFIQLWQGKKSQYLGKTPVAVLKLTISTLSYKLSPLAVGGMRYQSVIGFGRAHFINDIEEKKTGLNCIMQHYGSIVHQFTDDDVRKVCVIRIDIDSLTGKKHD
jgi:uncharacterized protein